MSSQLDTALQPTELSRTKTTLSMPGIRSRSLRTRCWLPNRLRRSKRASLIATYQDASKFPRVWLVPPCLNYHIVQTRLTTIPPTTASSNSKYTKKANPHHAKKCTPSEDCKIYVVSIFTITDLLEHRIIGTPVVVFFDVDLHGSKTVYSIAFACVAASFMSNFISWRSAKQNLRRVG